MLRPPIDPTDRERRLGNVAGILIELAKRNQAAEPDKPDTRPPEGDNTIREGEQAELT